MFRLAFYIGGRLRPPRFENRLLREWAFSIGSLSSRSDALIGKVDRLTATPPKPCTNPGSLTWHARSSFSPCQHPRSDIERINSSFEADRVPLVRRTCRPPQRSNGELKALEDAHIVGICTQVAVFSPALV